MLLAEHKPGTGPSSRPVPQAVADGSVRVEQQRRLPNRALVSCPGGGVCTPTPTGSAGSALPAHRAHPGGPHYLRPGGGSNGRATHQRIPNQRTCRLGRQDLRSTLAAAAPLGDCTRPHRQDGGHLPTDRSVRAATADHRPAPSGAPVQAAAHRPAHVGAAVEAVARRRSAGGRVPRRGGARRTT